MDRLNHSEQPDSEDQDKPKDKEQRILTERCQNFLRRTVPFSKAGEAIRARVENAIADGSDDLITEIAKELPTVENPRLDLFDDVHLTDHEKEVVFGYQNLSCVQITKGCSHQCEMCDRVDQPLTSMPLVMIGKIGEEIEKSKIPVEKVWDDWSTHIENITGTNLNKIDLNWFKEQVDKGFTEDAILLIRTIEKEFSGQEISKYFDQPEGKVPPVPIDRNDPRRTFQFLRHYYPLSPYTFRRELNIFNDSDPFDWRDTSLRHENGQIADLGDAFRMIATPLRPVFISTAGWQEGDQLGPIAAKKIVELCNEQPYLLSDIRISISPSEGLARKDLNQYREHMKNVILAFQGLPLNIVFRLDEDGSPEHREFEELVRAPLIKYVNELKLTSGMDEQHQAYYYRVQTGSVSHWKEHDDNPKYEEDADPGACMGGVHIWPDGGVAIQKGSHHKRPDKGSRPQRTELELYPLAV
ncbi:MAG: hypothetical protein WCG48_02015 [Candidatus Berkelbacteria bacterium]